MHLRSRIATVGVGVVAVGWAYMHIREGQLRSEREIARLNSVLAQVQAPQPRSGLPSADDAERRVIGRAAQVARDEARVQAAEALADHDPEDEGARHRPPPITFEESQQRVLSAFAAEAVDAAWGPEAERTLERIVRAHLPAGSRLNRVSCRSSMCELQMTHAEAKAESDFLMTGFHGWPGSLFVTANTHDHGEIGVTIIAAREGTEPPIAPR